MKENIFDYLKDYGFEKEDIFSFQDINDNLFFVDISLVRTNIKFFEDKELSKEEIIKVIKNNPFLLTIGSKKKELLDNIYYNIFTKEELKNLIINYPDSYIVNPLELKELIDYIKNKGLDIKEVINKDNSVLEKTIYNIDI